MEKEFHVFPFILCFLVVFVTSTPTVVKPTPNFINSFSLEFYKEAVNKNAEKSLIMSPLSAEVLLGLLSVGARGDTQKEIHDVIHMTNSETIKSTFQSTMGKLNKIQDVVLNVANKAYVKNGESFELDPAFKSTAVEQFYSDIENIDFSKTVEASRTINEWVKSKTNNKIKDIVSSKTLDPDTLVILVNAIYFQGNWEKPFNKRLVRKSKFNINKNDKIDVDMMHHDEDFSYADLPEWDSQILSLPYKNNDTHLVIILPKKIDGLKALEKKIYNSNIVDVLNKMRKTEIEIAIPKFKIESTLDLKYILPELGIKLIFNGQKADLHYLLKSHEQVFISEAKQKAFIEVNEHGTEAGVVTYFKIVPISYTEQEIKYFIADHPFFYMLIHKNDIIFCGRYTGV